MDRAAAQRWLDRYVEAWNSYDPEAIGALFSEDVAYRYHPGDEPIVGRTAVVRSWTEPDGGASSRDAPGTYEAEYRPWAVDGDRVVATGWTRYYTDATRLAVSAVYDNCFLIEFDPSGRCRGFTELYVRRPDPAA